jgi:PAS domain S-box-containing protein
VSAATHDLSQRSEQRETLFASIVRSSHDAIISMTNDGVVTSWNPSAEVLSGYPATEMVGQHVSVLWPAGQHAAEEKIMARVRRGERVDRYRTRWVRRDGVPAQVSMSLSPITDTSGAITGIGVGLPRHRGTGAGRGQVPGAAGGGP